MITSIEAGCGFKSLQTMVAVVLDTEYCQIIRGVSEEKERRRGAEGGSIGRQHVR
jgi:hypothetical protein